MDANLLGEFLYKLFTVGLPVVLLLLNACIAFELYMRQERIKQDKRINQ